MKDRSISFLRSRGVGKRVENFLATVLRNKYKEVNVISGEHKEYDIHIVDTNRKIECKYDRKSQFTGNIAIEYSYKKQPSGIVTTKADEWMIYLHNKTEWLFTFAPVTTIKLLCEGKRTVNGGDGFDSSMYLVPVGEYLKTPSVRVANLKRYTKQYGFNAD